VHRTVRTLYGSNDVFRFVPFRDSLLEVSGLKIKEFGLVVLRRFAAIIS